MAKVTYRPVNGGAKLYEQIQVMNLRNAHRAMADRILDRSMRNAPVLIGELRSDGRVEQLGDSALIVKFGDKRVPYARRRHFENRKNPQSLRYLEKAGNETVREGLEKFL